MSDKVLLVDGLSKYDPKNNNFRMVLTEKGPLLTDQVKLDMLAQGFNPLDQDDIRSFWAMKGISLNG